MEYFSSHKWVHFQNLKCRKFRLIMLVLWKERRKPEWLTHSSTCHILPQRFFNYWKPRLILTRKSQKCSEFIVFCQLRCQSDIRTAWALPTCCEDFLSLRLRGWQGKQFDQFVHVVTFHCVFFKLCLSVFGQYFSKFVCCCHLLVKRFVMFAIKWSKSASLKTISKLFTI